MLLEAIVRKKHARGTNTLFSPIAMLFRGWLGEKPPVSSSVDAEDEGFRQISFTFAVIALCAKLSVVDRPVTREEFLVFRRLFPMQESENGKINRLFVMACEDGTGFEHYATQVALLFPKSKSLYLELLDRLFKIAIADTSLQAEEVEFLRRVSTLLGISASEFRRMQNLYTSPHSTDPYKILGVAPRISNAGLKEAYRKLIREHHPDVLAANGEADDKVALAGIKLAAINEAYDKIRRKRGLK